MAHKTLIGGTAYEIKGGRTLVNGTDYDIKAGKTLVGGTAYDVSFGEPVTVNISLISGVANESLTYAEINGVKYTGTKTGLQVMSGDIIKLYCGATFSTGTPYVKINGTKTSLATGVGTITEWQVPSGVKTASLELVNYAGIGGIIVYTSEQTSANVTITGSGNTTYCYVTINGTKYTGETSGLVVQHGDVITVRTRGSASGTGAFVDKTENIYLSGEDANTSYTTSWYAPSVSNITFSLTYGTFDGKIGQVFVYKS